MASYASAEMHKDREVWCSVRGELRHQTGFSRDNELRSIRMTGEEKKLNFSVELKTPGPADRIVPLKFVEPLVRALAGTPTPAT